MLELSRVNSYYGRIHVLRDVSLRVGAGQIVTLLGANGAGKTTTLRTIVGLNRSAANDIRFEGEPLGAVAPYRIVERGIAMVPERREIFPDMTALENLELGAYRRRDQAGIAADLERVYALFPALAERRRQPGGTLSGGQQQMLALGRALMSRPRLLLLDEPTLGLAPLLVGQIFATLARLHAEGLTILLIEQNANQALGISSYGYILENGAVVLEGESASLRDNPSVQASYLGAA
ncbi:MAG TPA: ABC transporter ATP-binding protein [Burkholderiales bacterium]|nr:ABC transporter ATP-binding protein [Burkholderiales bacterium]